MVGNYGTRKGLMWKLLPAAIIGIAVITAAVTLGFRTEETAEQVPRDLHVDLPSSVAITNTMRATGGSDRYRFQVDRIQEDVETDYGLTHGSAVTATLYDSTDTGTKDKAFIAWANGEEGDTYQYTYQVYNLEGAEPLQDTTELHTCTEETQVNRVDTDSIAIDTDLDGERDTIYVAITCSQTSGGDPTTRYRVHAVDMETGEEVDFATTMIYYPLGGGEIGSGTSRVPSISLESYDATEDGRTPNAVFMAYTENITEEDGVYRYTYAEFLDQTRRSLTDTGGADIYTDAHLDKGSAIDTTVIDSNAAATEKDGRSDAVVIAYLGNGGASATGTTYRYSLYDISEKQLVDDGGVSKELASTDDEVWSYQPGVSVSSYRTTDQEEGQVGKNVYQDSVFAMFSVRQDQTKWYKLPLYFVTLGGAAEADKPQGYAYTAFDPSNQNPPDHIPVDICDLGWTTDLGGATIDTLFTPGTGADTAWRNVPRDKIYLFYSCDSDGTGVDSYRYNVFNPALEEGESHGVAPDNAQVVTASARVDHGPFIALDHRQPGLQPDTPNSCAKGNATHGGFCTVETDCATPITENGNPRSFTCIGEDTVCCSDQP